MIPIIVKLLPVFAIPPKLRTLNFILWIFILDLCYPLTDFLWTSLVAQMVGIYLYCRRSRFDPWVGKIPLEKGMATLSSILAWRIPWTEEPGWLQSMGLQRVRHDWMTEHAWAHAQGNFLHHPNHKLSARTLFSHVYYHACLIIDSHLFSINIWI